MINVMFICLGNICRSPMAELVFRDMVAKRGLADKIAVCSTATSSEQQGNGVHHGTVRILNQHHISSAGKYSIPLKASDYADQDYLIVMDSSNLSNVQRIVGNDPDGKIMKLLSFAGRDDDIADPYYTGDFETTYDDVMEGCTALLANLVAAHQLTA